MGESESAPRALKNTFYEAIRKFDGEAGKPGKLYELDHGGSIKDTQLYELLAKDYPISIFEHEHEDNFSQEGVSNGALYNLSRLPDEVVFGKNVRISLSDQTDIFLKNPHKSSDNRHQWYIVNDVKDEHGQDQLHVVMHMRGMVDIYNTLSSLARITQIREYYTKLKEPHDEYTAKVITQLEKQHTRFQKEHHTNDASALDAFTAGSYTVTQKDAGGVMIETKALTLMDQEGSLDAAGKFAALTKQRIEELKREGRIDKNHDPRVLEFSQAFAPTVVHLSALLRDATPEDARGTARTYDEYMTVTAKQLQEQYHGVKLSDIKDKSHKDFVSLAQTLDDLNQKYAQNREYFAYLSDIVKMQLINRYQGSDTIIRRLQDHMKDKDALAAHGIVELFDASNSPTADGAYFIDYTKIEDDRIYNYTPLLRKVMRDLKSKGNQKIVTTYALGDLTYEIAQQMKNTFPQINVVKEIGKVGAVLADNPPAKAKDTWPQPGDIFVQRHSVNMLAWLRHGKGKGKVLESPNAVMAEDFENLGSTYNEAKHQTPAVSICFPSLNLEAEADVRSHHIIGSKPASHVNILDMESYWYALLSGIGGINLIKPDYISDVMKPKGKKHKGGKIGESAEHGYYYFTALLVSLRAEARVIAGDNSHRSLNLKENQYYEARASFGDD